MLQCLILHWGFECNVTWNFGQLMWIFLFLYSFSQKEDDSMAINMETDQWLFCHLLYHRINKLCAMHCHMITVTVATLSILIAACMLCKFRSEVQELSCCHKIINKARRMQSLVSGNKSSVQMNLLKNGKNNQRRKMQSPAPPLEKTPECNHDCAIWPA